MEARKEIYEAIEADPDWVLNQFSQQFEDLYYRLLPAHVEFMMRTVPSILDLADEEDEPSLKVIIDLLVADVTRGLPQRYELLAPVDRALRYVLARTPVMLRETGSVRESYVKSISSMLMGAEKTLREEAKDTVQAQRFGSFVAAAVEHRRQLQGAAAAAQSAATRRATTQRRASALPPALAGGAARSPYGSRVRRPAARTKASLLLEEANRANRAAREKEGSPDFSVVVAVPGAVGEDKYAIRTSFELGEENSKMAAGGYTVVDLPQGLLGAVNASDFRALVEDALDPRYWRAYVLQYEDDRSKGRALSPHSAWAASLAALPAFGAALPSFRAALPAAGAALPGPSAARRPPRRIVPRERGRYLPGRSRGEEEEEEDLQRAISESLGRPAGARRGEGEVLDWLPRSQYSEGSEGEQERGFGSFEQEGEMGFSAEEEPEEEAGFAEEEES